jgi:LmbE family N-acetylglucosaminyl deacetylase
MEIAATAGELLLAARSFPFATLGDVLGSGGLLVVAPHPDDESLACGGLIAEACSQHRPTRVIVVSDGSGSHPRSKIYPKDALRQLREAETKRAVQELGLDPCNLVLLRLPDRFVPSGGPSAEEAIERIRACAVGIGAEAIFVSWRHDPHCDHQASYQLVREVQRRSSSLKIYEYTVWGAALPPEAAIDPVTDGFRIAIAGALAKKRRAITAHQSQVSDLIQDDPNGFRLSAADLARFDESFEFFFGSPD